jgi:hypothetical protein
MTTLWQQQGTERTIKLTIPWRAQSTAHKGIHAKSMGILLYPRREIAVLALRIRYEATNVNNQISKYLRINKISAQNNLTS